MYVNSAGITTELNYGIPGGVGGDVQVSTINVDNDGLHIKVNHQNHGMYFGDNRVQISGVLPDVKPVKLTTPYTADSTASISVSSGTIFENFENVGVGTTNVGYLRIGEEIIEYTSVSGNTVGGNIVRGSNPIDYPIGTPVFKYENSGINLHRINKTHLLSDATVSDPITFDSYYIKLDTSEKFNANNDDRSSDVGFPKLYIGKSQSTGGNRITATQNMPFEIITPIVHNVTVRGTSLTAEVRTTTGQSLSANEIPYVNNGFEPIVLNKANYLDTTRLICSKVNEDEKLTNVIGNKSMQMRVNLSTVDSRISPVIDGQRVTAILTSNRVNDVISDYASDSRVNGVLTDPTACQYISKEIKLENSATSIKILLSAHINPFSDIRAFYAIGNRDGFNPVFVPFPGWQNLDERSRVIAFEDSNGQPDIFTAKASTFGFDSGSIEYKEYAFTADKLPSFRSYRIKFVLTSTSQVYVPRVKDLRVIALA
jgi:hypothetical protein